MLVYLIFGGDFPESGGWGKYVRELATYLDQHDCRVKILGRMGKMYSDVGESPQNRGPANIRIANSSKQQSLRALVQHLPNPCSVFLGTMILLKDISKEYRCQKTLHIHDISCSLLIALAASYLYRLPMVVQIHGFPLKEQYIKLTRSKSSISTFVWFLTKMWHNVAVTLIKASKAPVLVNNNEVRSFYESCGISSEKIKVVSAAINLQRHVDGLLPRTQATACLGLDESTKRTNVGYIGGLRPEKNVETLISAFGKLVKHNHDLNVTLVIIGDGPTRSILEQLVSSYGIEDRVIFAGYIPDAYRFLNAIDIFVLPSLSEGSPLCILEAMASGRSIIASNIPAIEEILENGHDAILFNPSNPDQLEAAILTLYTNTEMRRKLMENAKKKSTRYDANVVFQRIIQLYQSVNQTKHHLSKTSSNNERTFYAPSVDCATTLK